MKKKLKIAMFIIFVLFSLLSLSRTPEFPTIDSDGYVRDWNSTNQNKIKN